ILQGRKLYLPDGKIVKLPKKKAKHSVSESHPGGAIISSNLVISNSNKQVKRIKLAFPTEELYGFSRNLCYFLSEGDFDDQVRNRWDAWSFKKGTRKIKRKYEWINPTVTVVDPGYIVLDNGIAIFIGENTTNDSWQLWALDIDNVEYSEITME
ncbi:MAG: hypothetical protein Q4D04_11570, partial [Clostridia bacterium]|nr:hypothetical protein [Clostridia bacterium]